MQTCGPLCIFYITTLFWKCEFIYSKNNIHQYILKYTQLRTPDDCHNTWHAITAIDDPFYVLPFILVDRNNGPDLFAKYFSFVENSHMMFFINSYPNLLSFTMAMFVHPPLTTSLYIRMFSLHFVRILTRNQTLNWTYLDCVQYSTYGVEHKIIYINCSLLMYVSWEYIYITIAIQTGQ